VSRRIAGVYTLNAPSDSAFAATRITASAVMMAQSAPFAGFVMSSKGAIQITTDFQVTPP